MADDDQWAENYDRWNSADYSGYGKAASAEKEGTAVTYKTVEAPKAHGYGYSAPAYGHDQSYGYSAPASYGKQSYGHAAPAYGQQSYGKW